MTLLANRNSYAQAFAVSNQLRFRALDADTLVGDPNGDGKVDVTDCTAIQMYLAEFSEFTDDQLRASDADGDGEISIADATAIQMYAAQLIDHLG